MKFVLSALVFVFYASLISDCHSTDRSAPASAKLQVGVTVADTFRIPQPRGYLTDLTDLFSPKEEQLLDSLIKSYENRTTVQIGVLTFDSSYTSRTDFDKFTLNTFNAWGVGVKGKDNGILIAICPDYKMIRIENGYGIEKILSNEETGQIIKDYITPSFKQGDYYQGVFDGIQRLTVILDQKFKT